MEKKLVKYEKREKNWVEYERETFHFRNEIILLYFYLEGTFFCP